MTVLDDARRLVEREPVALVGDEACMRWECSTCDAEADIGFPCRKPSPFPHTPDCPWLALPRIAAALEAAERLIERDPAFVYAADRPAYDALVKALRGEGVTA